MPDTKVSGLSAVAAFAGAQEFPVNDAGTSKKITGTQLIAAVAQGTLSGGYASITANQAGWTTAVDVTGLTVTVTPGTSRRIRITVFIGGVQSTVATDTINVFIMEGATQLTAGNIIGNNNEVTVTAILTPTAAAHTYKVQVARVGTGTGTVSAAATQPAYILAEDIGV